MNPSGSKRSTASVVIPRDSFYDMQKSVTGVELVAALTTEGVSEKKPSKMVEVAFHPLRPWIAAIEPKGNGIVWNYETKEIVSEFSLDISQEGGDPGEDEGSSTPTASGMTPGSGVVSIPPSSTSSVATAAAKSLLQRNVSPTATSYMKSTLRKGSSLRMMFYDHEAILSKCGNVTERICFDEWLIVLTITHVVVCDINQNGAVRRIAPDDLQRQLAFSIEVLPTGLLAIGCQDGKIRIWSPRLWKTVDTIDTGSIRDVQHLLLLSRLQVPDSKPISPTISSASDTTTLGVSQNQHYLMCATLDGKVVIWKVATAGTGEYTKVSEMELKDVLKALDTTSGLSDVKFHLHQETITATTRDGAIFFFDVSSLLAHGKSATLAGILPSSKLSNMSLIASTHKGSFSAVSISPNSSTLMISDLVVKGRFLGNYQEFAIGSTFESKDLNHVISQTQIKKLKLLSLTSSCRDPRDICCLTSYGVLILKACFLSVDRSVFVPRRAEKPPLMLFPGPLKVSLRFYGEETSTKQEDYKLQSGLEAINDRMKTPILQPCPGNESYTSVLLPASTHVEILQMDSELRNQKSINMHMIYSGNAVSIAWHPTKARFGLLVPQESNSRRITRAASSNTVPAKRRGFMFGGSNKGIANDEVNAADNRLHTLMPRTMSLMIYDISNDSHVELVEENCSSDEHHWMHIFSGPILGVVKYESDDSGSNLSSSFIGHSEGGTSRGSLDHHDSPSSMRTKRTESSVFGSLSTPTAASGVMGSSSFNSSGSASEPTYTCDVKNTYLEFYEWDDIDKDKLALGGTLKRIGNPISCPSMLEWERATNRFCALAYASSVKIYRVASSPPEVTCLHDIPTSKPAQSLIWLHHTLFLATEDEVMCCFMSKTRLFTFVLASRFHVHGVTSNSSDVYQFPSPQILPAGATTILGIKNQQLILSGPIQSIHTIDLSNKVLQCCMLISIGHADLALQVAETFRSDICEWIGVVFEAFGFVPHALQLSRLSLRIKLNLCIKHNVIDTLPQLLVAYQPDSSEQVGISLFHNGCACLYRSKQTHALLELFPELLRKRRYNDAVFLASLVQNNELLLQAHSAQEEWSSAFQIAKLSDGRTNDQQDILKKWNMDIQAATSSWKAGLEKQNIRPPEVVTLKL